MLVSVLFVRPKRHISLGKPDNTVKRIVILSEEVQCCKSILCSMYLSFYVYVHVKIIADLYFVCVYNVLLNLVFSCVCVQVYGVSAGAGCFGEEGTG